MKRIVMRMLVIGGLAGGGLVALSACASGPGGADEEPVPAPERTEVAEAPVEATHPRVNLEARSCVDCHEVRTPDAVQDWEESVHGETNVGCFVCHGDGQEQFMVRPEPELCMSCHAGELDDYEVVEGHTFRFIER